MKSSLFIGVDISKATLDVSMFTSSDVNTVHYRQFANQHKGFVQLLHWIEQNCEDTKQKNWHICMENTGMYSLELNCFLHEQGIHQYVENALQIKRSMGVVRGKNDKADSKTIALYLYRFHDKLRPYQLPGKVLLRLKALFAQRERLVEIRKGLEIALKSMAGYRDELIADIEQQNLKLLQELKSRIAEMNTDLEACLQQDQQIKEKAEQMQSVPGIGLQIAVYMLIVSRGMQSFASPRKFSCDSGCAPFSDHSGVSIQGKNRVHFIANKKMKYLLHMAAMSAITHDEELKQYYKRKVKEGKSPMSVLNAVRFKLICRVFSVVRRSETYKQNYQRLAA